MSRKHSLWLPFAAMCVAALLFGCTRAEAPAPADRSAVEAEIRALSQECLQAAQSRDMDKFLSYYAENAVWFPSQGHALAGRAAMRPLWKQYTENPGFSIQWTPTKISVSRSDDFAYEMGTYEVTANDAKGKLQTEKGHYFVMLQKQSDNSWKIVFDAAKPYES